MEKQTLQCDARAGAPESGAEVEPRPADVSPDSLTRKRYGDAVGGLVDEAIKTRTQAELVNVMAFNLAWLIVEYGPGAAGHVLERLGAHIAFFVERNKAAREAEAAREEGRLVN